jgi:hypothetical protein
LNWIKKLLGLDHGQKRSTYQPPNNPQPGQEPTSMNGGDFHSGPEGYSPNTAYPETQYGSGFDEDAEWNEGDWR